MRRLKVRKHRTHVGDFWVVTNMHGEPLGSFQKWRHAFNVADAHAEGLRELRHARSAWDIAGHQPARRAA